MLTSVPSSSFLRLHVYNLAHLCLIYPSMAMLYCVEEWLRLFKEGLFLKCKLILVIEYGFCGIKQYRPR